MAQTDAVSGTVVTGDNGAVVTQEAPVSGGSPLNDEGMPQTGIEAIEAGHTVVHDEPSALGMTATAWVSVAMLVLIAVVLWKKVPAAIGKSLDGRIEAIRHQLAEASELRAEAEALRTQYEKRLADAQQEAADIREQAESHLVEQAAHTPVEARQEGLELLLRKVGKPLDQQPVRVLHGALVIEKGGEPHAGVHLLGLVEVPL